MRCFFFVLLGRFRRCTFDLCGWEIRLQQCSTRKIYYNCSIAFLSWSMCNKLTPFNLINCQYNLQFMQKSIISWALMECLVFHPQASKVNPYKIRQLTKSVFDFNLILSTPSHPILAHSRCIKLPLKRSYILCTLLSV